MATLLPRSAARSGAHNEVSLDRGNVNGRTDNCGPLQFDHRDGCGDRKHLSRSLVINAPTAARKPAVRSSFYLSKKKDSFVDTSLGCPAQAYYGIINRLVLEARSIERDG